ncbi:hypothetical protein AVEN_209220-1, partial [Araneus ventricosus]
FESTRGLFWDGSRNFEPKSDGEDDTPVGIFLSKFLQHASERSSNVAKRGQRERSASGGTRKAAENSDMQ